MQLDVHKEHPNQIDYYADKDEIMAYAWTIYDQLKSQNLTHSKIIEIIQNNIDVSELCPVLQKYRRLFSVNSSVLKRLYKYVYEYVVTLEKEETNTF